MTKKVKSTTIHKYDVIYRSGPDSEPELEGYKYSYTQYDESGRIIGDIRYDEEGEVDEKAVFAYDSDGNIVDEKSFLADEELADHRTYERDDKGEILRSYRHYADGTKDTVEYRRDQKGNIIEKVTVDSDGETESVEKFEYHGDNLTKRQLFEYDELVLDESFIYDNDGNLSEQKRWTEAEEHFTYVNKYDSKQKITSILKYNEKDKLVARIDYEYNSKGDPVKITEESQTGINKTTIEYDGEGNAIRQTETNANGEINNRVERKFNEDGQVIETEAFIDYHGRAVNQHYILKYGYEYYDQSG